MAKKGSLPLDTLTAADKAMYLAGQQANTKAALKAIRAGADPQKIIDSGKFMNHEPMSFIRFALRGRDYLASCVVKETGITADRAGELLLEAIPANATLSVMALLDAGASVTKALQAKPHLIHDIIKAPSKAYGFLPAIRALLEAGLSPNVKNARGMTVIQSALAKGVGPYDFYGLLFAHGADPNCVGADGLHPLFNAVKDRGTSTFDYLIPTFFAHGLDPAVADQDGNTLLHHAIRTDRLEVASEMVEAGAPLGIKNRKGLTPRDILDWVVKEYYFGRKDDNRRVTELDEAMLATSQRQAAKRHSALSRRPLSQKTSRALGPKL